LFAVRLAFALALAATLAPVARPAWAAAPRMSPADRAAISVLVDRFVKGAVLRENLSGAWRLAGPGVRGGTTRADWLKGTGVTVQRFPARETDFEHAWTGELVSPNEAELSMILHPKPTAHGYDETAFAVDVRKLGGRWLVDSFYPAATFGKTGVVGSGDFQMFRGDRDFSSTNRRISGHWLLDALGAVGAVIVLIPLGVWVRVKRRDRRAWAAYTNTLR
jgi:hypothetical protein